MSDLLKFECIHVKEGKNQFGNGNQHFVYVILNKKTGEIREYDRVEKIRRKENEK